MMSRLADRLPENVPGEVYVDSSCIDCEICRFVAPETFIEGPDEMSIVWRQPVAREERRRAAMALVACPTSSIGTVSKNTLDVRAAAHAFPEPIEPGSRVHFCGYAAESSYGASSWLIVRPEGNILVDSPRVARPLLERIEELGGVKMLFLTHRDDVADHEKLAARFGCERIIHADDVSHDTRAVERRVVGRDPVALADDLLAIPVPGHTRGSMALLHDRHLFTGDHLWWSVERKTLHASRSVSWFSWREQTASMAKLLEHRFEWVLPGHGWRWKATSAEAMREELSRLVTSMKQWSG